MYRFCPKCGGSLKRIVLENKERFVCELYPDGCNYINFGIFSIGVGGIIIDDEQTQKSILLVQRNHEPNRGYWTIPSGYVESDEPAEAAVIREIREETGYESRVSCMVGFRNRLDGCTNNAYIIFLCAITGGTMCTVPSEEVACIRFFNLQEVNTLEKLSPLSKTIAYMALSGLLIRLNPRRVPQTSKTLPPVTLFMGSSEEGNE